MGLPQEAREIFIVHRGAQIHGAYISPVDAIKELRKLIQDQQPCQLSQGFEEYGMVCNRLGLEQRTQLSMVEARQDFERNEIFVEAWKKGRTS